MIVVRAELHSAIDGRIETLGTVVIDNVTEAEKYVATKGRVGDYRVRAWPKGAPRDARQLLLQAKAHREGRVEDHRRLAKPIWNLVRKALESMEY